jgi:hypothetical protein
MMFGRKARLLADLIGHSDHPKRAELLGCFNKIRGNNKRDIFAHSYQRSNSTHLTFVERSTGGEFRANAHQFSLEDFERHTVGLMKLGIEFFNLLGATPEAVTEFADAAFKADRRDSTSPHKPEPKA